MCAARARYIGVMSTNDAFTPVMRPGAFKEPASADHFDQMRRAAEELYELHRQLAKTGDNIVGELLKTESNFFEWDHYPAGDVYDRETHGQYYYHAHPTGNRAEEEHGHFHSFLRPLGMPEGIEPAPVSDFVPPEDPNDALSHLIAISMNSRGLPVRLFTVNRWVTGETWYKAPDVIAMLDHFAIEHTQPSWPVNYWISRIPWLFRPQVEDLIRARDRILENEMGSGKRDNILEDREIEVVSYCDISLEDQINALLGARPA